MTRSVVSEQIGPEGLLPRVHQAAAWCEAQAKTDDPHGSLRQLGGPGDGGVTADSVRKLCAEREDRLGVAQPVTSSLPGQLLVLEMDEQLADGASEVATGGYFDVDNVPPWDSWIALFENVGEGDRSRALLSYVPRSLLDLAARGVWSNPERCLLWLHELDPPLDLGTEIPALGEPPGLQWGDHLGPDERPNPDGTWLG